MALTNSTIPPINRPEWIALVKGELSCEFTNYVLKMKINDCVKNIAKGDLKPEDAVASIHALCSKYSLAVQEDCKKIFKTW